MLLDKREKFDKRTAEILGIDEAIVHKIISFQWKLAYEGASGTAASIDVTGFGRFITRPKKILQRLDKYHQIEKDIEAILQRENLSDKKKENYDWKLASVRENIKRLTTKIR